MGFRCRGRECKSGCSGWIDCTKCVITGSLMDPIVSGRGNGFNLSKVMLRYQLCIKRVMSPSSHLS